MDLIKWKEFSDKVDEKNKALVADYFKIPVIEREEKKLYIKIIEKSIENFLEWQIGKFKIL